MGRLFWKFFMLAAVAQFVTVIGVGTWVWTRHEARMPELRERGSALERRLDEAVAAFERGGVTELRSRLEAWHHEPGPQVFAIDARGEELLGRRVVSAAEPGPEVSAPHITPPDPPHEVRRVGSGDTALTLSLGARVPGPGGPFGNRPRFPVEPVVGGLVASLLLAALLAMYVAKPIRHLRQAFDAVAEGDLDVRVSDAIGRRRDELADLGRDFDRTVERLQALVEGQRRLLHTVSHELRSPLARMQAAVGLARQSKDVEAAMERIEREAERMDRLVDELLTLSRVQSRVADGDIEEVGLAELVAGVIDDTAYEVDASRRPVKIESELAALDGSIFRGNSEMLHRAIENVLRNAVRHASVPGTVRVSAVLDHDGRHAVIAIADDGPGVPPDELSSIFEPFFRGEGARPGEGHGLGLAITCGVVEAHGGRVSATNGANGGLIVELRLPATSAVTKIYPGGPHLNGA